MKLRWYQFRLSRFMILVTMCAVCVAWFVWQRSMVEERHRLIKEIRSNRESGSSITVFRNNGDEWIVDLYKRVPYVWQLLGAEAVFHIYLDRVHYNQEDLNHCVRMFPEAVEISFDREEAEKE